MNCRPRIIVYYFFSRELYLARSLISFFTIAILLAVLLLLAGCGGSSGSGSNLPFASINNRSLNEGNSGVTGMIFRVTLSRVADAEVRINYTTSDGTAEDQSGDNDYLSASGTVIIPLGQQLSFITVYLNGDTVEELDESFSVVLSDPQNASIAAGTGTGTILNDDSSAPTDVTVSGTVTYDHVPTTTGSGLDYGSTVAMPVRIAVVKAIRTFDSVVLDSTLTDTSGDYSVIVPENTDILIRVKAQLLKVGTPSWDFQVVDNTNEQALYVMDSAEFNSGTVDITNKNLHADSGWGGSSYASERTAAPFSLLDLVNDAVQLVLTGDPSMVFPQLLLNWSPNNVAVDGDPALGQIGTSYYDPLTNQIYILGYENSDTDEYDRHVIAHEWGHYFENNFSRTGSMGGPHGGGDRLDPRIALAEGWGNAFSGMATGDPDYVDTFGSQQSITGLWMDLDDNSFEESFQGWFSEASVQIILYDLYDDPPVDDDDVGLGFAPIFDVLTDKHKNTDAFCTIFSLITYLKEENPPDAAAIDALVEGEDIVSATMDIWGSTETNNAGDANTLPVYNLLTVGGGSIQVTCSDTFGDWNKLLNRHLFYFEILSPGSYTITAVPDVNGDCDLVLYKNGVEIGREEDNWEGVTETLIISLTPGFYTGEIYEYKALLGTMVSPETFDLSLD